MANERRDGVIEDSEDAKPWCLPFWTDAPDFAMERDNLALVLARREAKERQASRQRRLAPEPEPVASGIEETLVLPTAEELENIRREAWNAGLEQGLVEGRQQGHKAGYDEGFAEGRKAGHDKGLNEGKGEGLRQGREEGLAKARQEVDAEVAALQALQSVVRKTLLERDQDLPEVLATLIVRTCEQVLGYELRDGARRILDYVEATIARLPEAEQNQARIFVSPADAACLEHHLLETGQELHYHTDASLAAGECRIQSPHSRGEFNLHEQLQQLLQEMLPLLEQAVPDPATVTAQLQQELATELEWQQEEVSRQVAEREQAAEAAAAEAAEAAENRQPESEPVNSMQDLPAPHANTSDPDAAVSAAQPVEADRIVPERQTADMEADDLAFAAADPEADQLLTPSAREDQDAV